ncbi:MAG: hypothetical protein VB143_08560, partial [Burkholderia sp.]
MNKGTTSSSRLICATTPRTRKITSRHWRLMLDGNSLVRGSRRECRFLLTLCRHHHWLEHAWKGHP